MARRREEVTALVAMSQDTKQAVTSYTGHLFSDIDFQGLNVIINKITNNTEELSDSMRIAASKFADDWNNLVVRRLDEKEYRLNQLYHFFNFKAKYYNGIAQLFEPQGHYCQGSYITDESGIVYAVLRIFQSNSKWHKHIQALQKLISEYKSLHDTLLQFAQSEDEIEMAADISYAELVALTKEKSLVKAQNTLKVNQLKFDFCKHFTAYMKKIQTDQSIQDFTTDLYKQVRQAVNAKAIVEEKSSLVKLSINFGGTDLLKALRELHDFQETL